MENVKYRDCALVILSNDNYKDIWENCLHLHDQYWEDCPFDRILISDTLIYSCNRLRSITADKLNLSWTEMTRYTVEKIDKKYILLMLDDFFITEPVNTDAVIMLFKTFIKMNAAYLRLIPHLRWASCIDNSDLVCEHKKGLPYRTSLQAAFWKKEIFLELLSGRESPWQFELYGSMRSDKLNDLFLMSYIKPINYIDVLYRGKWLKRGLRLCKNENLKINLIARPKISFTERTKRFLAGMLSIIKDFIPNCIRRVIRNWRYNIII